MNLRTLFTSFRNNSINNKQLAFGIGLFLLGFETVFASGSSGFESTFLWVALLLIIAKLSGIIERIKQPAVLGELLIGVVLGNLALMNVMWFEPIKTDMYVKFIAELGVIILLFQVGLESTIHEMKKVGLPALLVALIGVVLPFVLGTFVVGPLLIPKEHFTTLPSNITIDHVYLFLGATLTATSVGITARVFQDLNVLRSKESQIVLGAAVIDDILGLIILAVVTAIIKVGTVSGLDVVIILAKAIGFLVGAVLVGTYAAPLFTRFLSIISKTGSMKFTFVISFCLLFSYLAYLIGLAPIVGAFAAGLVLDQVHYKHFDSSVFITEIRSIVSRGSTELKNDVETALIKHDHHHVEELVAPLGMFVTPVFFVLTGMLVDLRTFMQMEILLSGLAISAVAIVGKLLAGLGAGKGKNKLLVGIGMVPRGEVGLIFASTGKAIGVVNDEIYSIIVIMVIVTTLITPPLLSIVLKRSSVVH